MELCKSIVSGAADMVTLILTSRRIWWVDFVVIVDVSGIYYQWFLCRLLTPTSCHTHLKTHIDYLIFFKRPEPFLLEAQLDFASDIIASETET